MLAYHKRQVHRTRAPDHNPILVQWSAEATWSPVADATLHIQAIEDRRTVPVLLDRNPLYVEPRRRRVLVAKRILRLNDASCRLAHPVSERKRP